MCRFEEAFRVDRGHASGTGGGYGLPVLLILHIAGRKNTRHTRRRAVGRADIPIRVQVQLADEEIRIGPMPEMALQPRLIMR